MSNTKIVLNRQSDLILDNANITAPVGIVIADIAGLVSTVESIDSKGTGDISAEASLRVVGDVSVTAAMSAEISTRIVAETSLANDITAEASSRVVSDTAEESRAMAAEGMLQDNINTEESRAIAAEGSLEATINNVISNIDPAALDSLTEIVGAFQSADGDLNGSIVALSSAATANLTAEESRAIAAEGSIAANLSTELVDRAAAVSTEEAARISGDVSIALDLSSEVQARISDVDFEQARAESAEAVLTADLSSELVARASAIDNEASIRLAADGSIAANLSTELSAVNAFIISETIAEESSRVSGDVSIAANLSTELVARASADASIALNVSTSLGELPMTDGATIILDATTNTVQLKEAVAAPASGTRTFSGLINVAAQPATLAGFGDLSLVTKGYASAAVSTEASVRLAADASIATGLSSELVARLSADNSLEDNLTEQVYTEYLARISADLSLDTKLNDVYAEFATEVQAEFDAEASTRLAADLSIDTNLSTEKGRIDAILLASDADKDSFAEIVTLINSVDTTNDEAFAGYVLSNNAALSTELVARESADASLYDQIDSEYHQRMEADNSIAAELSSEIVRAELAEGSLATQISTELSTANASVEGALSTEVSRAESAEASLDVAKLNLAGGTMQGGINMGGNNVENINTAKVGNLETSSPNPSNPINLNSNIYGNGSVGLENIQFVSGLVTPTNDGDAANKLYVDSALSAEISRAEFAEASIATQLSSEVSYIIANTDLTSIDSFAEVVANQESIAIDLSAEIGALAGTDEQTIELNTGDNTIRLKETVAAPASGIRTLMGEINVETILKVAGVDVMVEISSEVSNRIAGDASIALDFANIYSKHVPVIETPDGETLRFTLDNAVRAGSELIYMNGLLLDAGDYTPEIGGDGKVSKIDFISAPLAGDKVRAYGVC